MTQTPQQPQNTGAPNDQGVVHVEGFLRITDPNTKEIIVEQRA